MEFTVLDFVDLWLNKMGLSEAVNQDQRETLESFGDFVVTHLTTDRATVPVSAPVAEPVAFKYHDFGTWWDLQTDIDDDSYTLARRIFSAGRLHQVAAQPAADNAPQAPSAGSVADLWQEHWQGSHPYKGWSIKCGRDEVVWLGTEISGDDVTAIVMAHNKRHGKCIDCDDKSGCVMNCSGLSDAPSANAQAPDSAAPIGYVNARWAEDRKGTTTVYPEPHPRLATFPLIAAPSAHATNKDVS